MGYKIESDLRAFVLIEHKSIIPNNEKAMDRYCKWVYIGFDLNQIFNLIDYDWQLLETRRAKAIPKQMKQFKQCVNNFSQQIINLITPNLSKAIRKMCITEKKG